MYFIEYKFFMKLKKYIFYIKEIEFLGFIISVEGVMIESGYI